MIPPIFMRLRVNGFGVWLPVVLLWPFLLLLAPFVALFGAFTAQPLRAVEAYYFLLCSFRGLQVHVRQPGQIVDIQLR